MRYVACCWRTRRTWSMLTNRRIDHFSRSRVGYHTRARKPRDANRDIDRLARVCQEKKNIWYGCPGLRWRATKTRCKNIHACAYAKREVRWHRRGWMPQWRTNHRRRSAVTLRGEMLNLSYLFTAIHGYRYAHITTSIHGFTIIGAIIPKEYNCSWNILTVLTNKLCFFRYFLLH